MTWPLEHPHISFHTREFELRKRLRLAFCISLFAASAARSGIDTRRSLHKHCIPSVLTDGSNEPPTHILQTANPVAMASIPASVIDSVKSLGLNGSTKETNGTLGDVVVKNICCVGAGYVGKSSVSRPP